MKKAVLELDVGERNGFFDRQDTLGRLNLDLSVEEKLSHVHEVLRQHLAFVDRMAVAVFSQKPNRLRTFAHARGPGTALERYCFSLTETPRLREIIDLGQARVINDLGQFPFGGKDPTRHIIERGYRASYILPLYSDGAFFGLIFFDSLSPAPFAEESLRHLDIYGRMVGLMLLDAINSVEKMIAALKTARDMTHQRDFETGMHVERMSRYSRLIAMELAADYGFSEEYIEHLFLFAALHDIGKIAVPDRILLKPGMLTAEEYALIKLHVDKGLAIIDEMLSNFSLEGLPYVDVLRNITRYHHESLDGSGYPEGLKGEAIPIEARIVAVADVFDAMTSPRPYKTAWSNDDAFATLERLAGKILDRNCVQALIKHRAEVERIQVVFRSDLLDAAFAGLLPTRPPQ